MASFPGGFLAETDLCLFSALVVMNAAAEQQYFKVDENRNWTEARMYCQVRAVPQI